MEKLREKSDRYFETLFNRVIYLPSQFTNHHHIPSLATCGGFLIIIEISCKLSSTPSTKLHPLNQIYKVVRTPNFQLAVVFDEFSNILFYSFKGNRFDFLFE